MLTILGSTGSIGTSTLDVVRQNRERFPVFALSAGKNVELLASQIREFGPQVVVTGTEADRDRLRAALHSAGVSSPPELAWGPRARVAVATAPEVTTVLSAIVGVTGLEATYEAVRAGKRIALANKEVLVSAGQLVMEAVREAHAELVPVDSEHNGAHQCLRAGNRGDVTRLILTASGGPFRNTPRPELENVTPAMALNHPTWKMGNRITIDSATLMNKGFEVIEACWLFDFDPAEVEVVVHPQSTVHAMVEYNDGSVIAQVCATDMRMPIQYALTYPDRWPAPVPRIDWRQARQWEFYPPDLAKFPLLALAYEAQRAGGSATCTLNAADEIAVAAFLSGKIGFTGIHEVVAETLSRVAGRQPASIQDILEVDRESRSVAEGFMAARSGRAAVQASTMVFFENLLWLLVLIGVMILIHELGHFWAARYFDVRVEVFSFGFGPRLFGFRRGETDYRFSAILFGGYVKMMGELAGDDAAQDPRSFLAKPRWQRLIIAFAGPLMNIILSIGLQTGLYMVKFQKLAEPPVRGVIGHVIAGSAADKAGLRDGDRIAAIDGEENPSWEEIMLKEVSSAFKPVDVTVERNGKRFHVDVTPVLEERQGVGYAGWSERTEVEVGSVSAGMPAEKAGLRKGDLLISINGNPIHARLKLRDLIQHSKGEPATVEFERDGQRRTVKVTPVLNNADGQSIWMIGVLPEARFQIVTTQLSLPLALQEAIKQNRKGATMIVGFLKGIIERRMSAKQLQGPIGIAQLSGEAAREGPTAFIHLMSMVSLNLAIFNLLPIPILDGGVILLLLVEMLMRRDLSLQVKEAVIKVGFVFLMVVTVFALYNDISKILPG